MRRTHTTLLLLLTVFCLNLSAQKFISLYDSGEYQKSLDACKKVIEKDKTNLDAYFYKSLNQLQLAIPPQVQKVNIYGIEASLSSLQFMQYKKGGPAYVASHKQDADRIMHTAFEQANLLFDNGDLKLSERLLNDIFKLDSLPEYYYLSGKIKCAKHNWDAGLSDMNIAAAEIYHAVQKGENKPYLPELFIDLAKGIYNEGDKQSAYVLFYRAIKLFNSDSITSAFISTINYDVDSNTVWTDKVMEETTIRYLDSLQAYVKDEHALHELKWKCVNSFFNTAYYGNDVAHAQELLENYSCHDSLFFERSNAILCSEIIQNTTIDFIFGKDSVRADTKPVLLQQQFITCSGKKPADYFNRQILLALDSDHYLDAAKLFHNYKSYYTDKKLLADTKGRIISGTKTFYVTDSAYADCRKIAAIMNDASLFALISSKSVNIVEKLIAEKKFSEAGVIIRSNYEKYPDSEPWKFEYKKWVIADYTENYLNSEITQLQFAKEYSTDYCEPGKLSPATQKIFLQRLNYVRRLAGISDKCRLNDSLNAYAQAAALMMEANYSLSHMPPSDWKCYSAKGANGASHSNLSLGYNSVDALMGQMDDSGGSNGSVGHRRWILNPYNTVYGHGSTGASMALYVFGTNGYDASADIYRTRSVTWPPAGYCPSPFNSARWSFSLDAAYFDKATVEVTCKGKKLPLTILPLEPGYGLNTIVWEIEDLPYSFSQETTYYVTIKGITSYSDDTARSYKYSITFLPVESVY